MARYRALWVCLLALGSLIPCPGAGRPVNGLENGGFERPGGNWQMDASASFDSIHAHSGRQSVKLHSATGAQAIYDVSGPRAGQVYSCSGWVRTDRLRPLSGGGYAYLAIYRYGLQDNLIAYNDFAHVSGTTGWQKFTVSFACEESVDRLSFRIGVRNAAGTAWFDDLTLVERRLPLDFSQVAEPRGASLARTGPGSVAILSENLPVRGKPSSPQALASTLQSAGYRTEILSAARMADSRILNRQRFDLAILPTGASFPAQAAPAFQNFLRQGGDFLTMGGYAFDSLWAQSGGRWLPQEQAAGPKPVNRLANPGFEAEGGWLATHADRCRAVAERPFSGRRAARITVPSATRMEDTSWRQNSPVPARVRSYRFTGRIRCQNIGGGDGFAYLAVYQYNREGKLGPWQDVVQLRGSRDWQKITYNFNTASDTTRIHIKCGIYQAAGTAWFDDLSLILAPPEVRLNARKGVPGDGLLVAPSQIGVFDPSYRLRRVRYAQAAPGQFIYPARFRLDAPLTGYAAAGVTGGNNARWIPLLNGCDRYGRLRGSAGSLMRNYNGPYQRSSWAFFGAANRDLFDMRSPALRRGFLALVADMMRETYLHHVETGYAAYRPGESVRLQGKVSNFGHRARPIAVEAIIREAPSGKIVYHQKRSLVAAPGETRDVAFPWPAPRLTGDFYKAEMRLSESGRPFDTLESAFYVLRPAVARKGFPLAYRDNYLRAGNRPLFLQGTDTYSIIFFSASESPLTWERDVEKCMDHQISVFENLQGGWGPDHQPAEGDWRKIDGLIQQVQKSGGIYFAGLHIGVNVAVSDEELGKQQEFCRVFARRYRHIPGLIYYLNGDYQLNVSNIPDLKRLWNAFLKERYGDDGALRAAWQVSPPSGPLGTLDVEDGSARWDDVRTFDAFRFRAFLLKRWNDAMASAIRTIDADHPITSEYYQQPAGGIDPLTGSQSLDIVNIGYFDEPVRDLERFPKVFKFIDGRIKGKSLNVGEFGVKTHPAWAGGSFGYHTARAEVHQFNLFLNIPQLAFGLGGSKVQNWCWNDSSDSIFPWGLNYPNDRVSKDALPVYRNTGLLLRQFRPRFEPPATVFLIADNHRMGGGGETVRQGILNGLQALHESLSDFAVLNEQDLDKLPARVRTIVYPLPYCPDDRTVALLKRFVSSGGTLYLSGDIAYDPLRRRVRNERLDDLCGVTFIGENYANIAYPEESALLRPTDSDFTLPAYRGHPSIRVRLNGARAVMTAEDGSPAAVIHPVGEGRVWFHLDPVELHSPPGGNRAGRFACRAFLRWAGVSLRPIHPENPSVLAFTVPTEDSESVMVLRNTLPKPQNARFSLGAQTVSLDLGPDRIGLAAFRADGSLHAAEAQGCFTVEPFPSLFRADMHLIALALDGKDLAASKAVALLPMGTGQIALNSRAHWRKAQLSVGEIRNGRWAALETLPAALRKGAFTLAIDSDRSLNILLLTESEEAARWRQALSRMRGGH
ncbi:MAG: hypothetical protein IT210_18500 [Armatimonadetes bacterium]|nr:hypothetical protein [Armatimonadota bacterium]